MSRISPLAETLDSEYKAPGVIFLLTPSFSTWLLNDETFLTKAVRRLFKRTVDNPDVERTIHVFAAVVDRVTGPPNVASQHEGEVADVKPRIPSTAGSGHEGLVYIVGNHTRMYEGTSEGVDVFRRNEPTSDIRVFTVILRPDKKSFASQTSQGTRTVYREYRIEVPLANTIFHTGQQATIFKCSYDKSGASTDLQLVEKARLSSLVFNPPLSTVGSLDTAHLNSQSFGRIGRSEDRSNRLLMLALPLIPLTVPRRIDAGMGNIVRQISHPEESSRSVPASQELEKSVASFFQARDVPPHAMNVWALVIPSALYTALQRSDESSTSDTSQRDDENAVLRPERLDKIWRAGPPPSNIRLLSMLEKGAELHRVLSGGGGWGKKAGLLSLDPVSRFANTDNGDSSNFFEGFSSEDHGGIGEVAKPGDYIQFFALEDTSDHFDYGPASYADPQGRSISSADLGTIPSSIDVLPTVSSDRSSSISTPNIEKFEAHFGILSEAGLSLRIVEHKTKTAAEKLIVQTKVDVPYSRFSLLRVLGHDDKLSEPEPSENLALGAETPGAESILSSKTGLEHSNGTAVPERSSGRSESGRFAMIRRQAVVSRYAMMADAVRFRYQHVGYTSPESHKLGTRPADAAEATSRVRWISKELSLSTWMISKLAAEVAQIQRTAEQRQQSLAGGYPRRLSRYQLRSVIESLDRRVSESTRVINRIEATVKATVTSRSHSRISILKYSVAVPKTFLSRSVDRSAQAVRELKREFARIRESLFRGTRKRQRRRTRPSRRRGRRIVRKFISGGPTSDRTVRRVDSHARLVRFHVAAREKPPSQNRRRLVRRMAARRPQLRTWRPIPEKRRRSPRIERAPRAPHHKQLVKRRALRKEQDPAEEAWNALAKAMKGVTPKAVVESGKPKAPAQAEKPEMEERRGGRRRMNMSGRVDRGRRGGGERQKRDSEVQALAHSVAALLKGW